MEISTFCGVPVSRDLAWQFWTNVENWPTVDGSVESVRLNGPFAAGSTGVTRSRDIDPVEWRLVEVNDGSSAVIEIRRSFFLIRFKTCARARAATTALLLALCIPAALAQTAPARQPTQPESALNADEILQQMSRITGLPIKASLKKKRVSKAEVEKYLRENFAAEYTPAEIHGQEAALEAFGLVGPDFNLQTFLVSLYTEQAAGFYDPRRKTMFMADWVGPDQEKMVLAHELTHALQDQSFDLWKFMHATPDNDDASAARQALVEGYATLSMIQAMLMPPPAARQPLLDGLLPSLDTILPSLDTMMNQMVNQQMAQYPVFSEAPFFCAFKCSSPTPRACTSCARALRQAVGRGSTRSFKTRPRIPGTFFSPIFTSSRRINPISHRPRSICLRRRRSSTSRA